jgi:hypothetical protein
MRQLGVLRWRRNALGPALTSTLATPFFQPLRRPPERRRFACRCDPRDCVRQERRLRAELTYKAFLTSVVFEHQSAAWSKRFFTHFDLQSVSVRYFRRPVRHVSRDMSASFEILSSGLQNSVDTTAKIWYCRIMDTATKRLYNSLSCTRLSSLFLSSLLWY